jgi:hypothetical protein
MYPSWTQEQGGRVRVLVILSYTKIEPTLGFGSSNAIVRQKLHPMIAQRMTMLLRAGVVSRPGAHHNHAMQTSLI